MKKHPIKNTLKEQGYNFKERASIYAGSILGTLAPIAAGRYLLFPTGGVKDNILAEGFAWGASTLVNISPLIIRKPPIPFYGFMAGLMTGGLYARRSQKKRLGRELGKENSLESGLNNNLENSS